MQSTRGQGLFYGWVVVGVTVAALLVSAGIRAAPGVLIVTLYRPARLRVGALATAPVTLEALAFVTAAGVGDGAGTTTGVAPGVATGVGVGSGSGGSTTGAGDTFNEPVSVKAAIWSSPA